MRCALVLLPYQDTGGGAIPVMPPTKEQAAKSGPRWGRWPAGLVGKAAEPEVGRWMQLHLRPRKRLLNCFEVKYTQSLCSVALVT